MGMQRDHGRRVPVKEPKHDDERMSALLAQRLDERQREELLAHLSTSDDDRRIFADTAAILHELEAAEAGADPQFAKVIPLRPKKPKTPVLVALGAIAAVLAALALLPVLAPRGGADAAGDPLRLALRAEPARAGLPEGWIERDRWISSRGNDGPRGDTASMTSAQRATRSARAGVLLVDLAVAVGARDTADTRLLARQIQTRFEVPSALATLQEIGERAGAPAESLAPLVRTVAKRVSGRLDTDYVQLGAWTEAARVAAEGRNDAFFRDRAMLKRAERLTRDDPAAHAALARVRARVDGTMDWVALRGDLDALLREIAS
jgi:hypothetical protein